MGKKTYKAQILPEKRSLLVNKDQRLLESFINAGLLLRSDCGGKGRCGKCIVKLSNTSLDNASPPEEPELRTLGSSQIEAGFRLACQVSIRGDITVEIPETSRLHPEVGEKGPLIFSKKSPSKMPLTDAHAPYGFAVDLGTTTIALYLCDLARGNVISTLSVRNPQALFGDDVMSRIGAATRYPDGVQRLQRLVVNAIDWGISSLCRAKKIEGENISKCVVVGNSTMIHLFVGESPATIGTYPYKPLFVEDRHFKAEALGFSFNPSTDIYTLPLIAGFLGADIVSAALATDFLKASVGTVLVDVGTNGEVMLMGENGIMATSCATGPAFEGATIAHGMHAVSGAIDGIQIDSPSGNITCSVIRKTDHVSGKPAGICGTGVISAVAELFQAGYVTQTGRYNKEINLERLRFDENNMLEFVLVPSEQSETQRAIVLTQKDVRAVQLAKGALLAGIDLLCRYAQLRQPSQLLIAGAFGNYIDKTDARTIGLFPNLKAEQIQMVGNAAGAGAILCLFDLSLRNKAREIAQATEVLDLASLPEFQKTFMAALPFPPL